MRRDLQVLALGALFGSIVVMIAIAALVAVLRNRRAHDRTGALAAALQLSRVPGTFFFAGTYRSHPIALAHAHVKETLGGEDGRRFGTWRLRLAVGLVLRAPLHATVARASSDAGGDPRDFSSFFRCRNAEVLSPDAREALARFALSYGHLSFSDTARARNLLGGADTLERTDAVLVHDSPGLDHDVETVRATLDAMIAACEPLHR